MELSEHQGVISLGDHTIQVTLGINEVEVHLVADDTRVGKWSHTECQIVAGDSGTFLIEAENDSLPFIPRDPDGFARVLTATIPQKSRAAYRTPISPADVAPPRPITVALFYGLSAVTAGLGIWAVWTLVF